jgi:sugar/nucleoside kinase (ribokinase family)
MDPSPPQMLAIGPYATDVIADERRQGGAVAYAARAARSFGMTLAILTIGDPDSLPSAFDGHDVTVVPDNTLTFEHTNQGDDRELTVVSQPSRALDASDLPEGWAKAETVMLMPLVPQDDCKSFADIASDGRRALLGQGLQRALTSSSRVIDRSRPSADLVRTFSRNVTVFLSEQETSAWTYEEMTLAIGRNARVVITRGAAGSDIYGGGHDPIHIDATPAEPVDTNGAGDVFATAFMIALARGDDDETAGRLASAYAAASVENVGAAELPPLTAIEARIGTTSA